MHSTWDSAWDFFISNIVHQAPFACPWNSPRILTRILEWVAIPFPRDLLDPGNEPTTPTSPALAVRFFITSATRETPIYIYILIYYIAYTHTHTHTHTIGQKVRSDHMANPE